MTIQNVPNQSTVITFCTPVGLFVKGQDYWSQLDRELDIPANSQVTIGNLTLALDYLPDPANAPETYVAGLFLSCEVVLPEIGKCKGYILHENLEHASEILSL